MVINLMHLIEERFNVNKEFIRLADPIFVTQITNNTPTNLENEQYFHDRVGLNSCHYTAIMYLNDFNKDFTGGRFIFNDGNKTKGTVDPKFSRVLLFTTGPENTNYIEQVKTGIRYAMTISFTCETTPQLSLERGSLADMGV